MCLPEMPYPVGDPMVTALKGSNITISCTEVDSLPPAKTVWMRKDKIINTTSKYIVSDNNPNYKLTIINVTKEDEGTYFCHSENPLGRRELEVYLTVKSKLEILMFLHVLDRICEIHTVKSYDFSCLRVRCMFKKIRQRSDLEILQILVMLKL